MKAALASFPMPWLSCIGALLFLSIFLGIAYFTFRKSVKANYERAAWMALEETEK